jgi:hypothetical protein
MMTKREFDVLLSRVRERAKEVLSNQSNPDESAAREEVMDFLEDLWNLTTDKTHATRAWIFLLILYQFRVKLDNGRGAWVHLALDTLDPQSITKASLIRMISEGRIGDAFQLALALVRLHLIHAGGFSPERRYSAHNSEYESHVAGKFLSELYKPAYELALAEGRYGIALALYRQNSYPDGSNGLIDFRKDEDYEVVREQLSRGKYSEKHRKALESLKQDFYASYSRRFSYYLKEDREDWKTNQREWRTTFEEVKDLLHFAYVGRCRKVEENLVKAAAEARQLPRLELTPNFICPCFCFHTRP